MDNQVLKFKKTSKKRAGSSKSKDVHRIVEDYKLLDGAVSILRTTKSGSFWSMSCWLRGEGKCFRKSLRTKDKEQAMELAREEYFKIQGNIRAGNKIYSITTRELVDEFIKHKASEAKSGLRVKSSPEAGVAETHGAFPRSWPWIDISVTSLGVAAAVAVDVSVTGP